MVRIIVFWDSITWGANDLEMQGWVNRLRNYYENNNKNISVYNCWISWDNTDDLLYRFDGESNARYYQRSKNIIIFAIWINDSQYINEKWNNTTNINKFKSNILQLISKAKDKYEIIFLWLTNVDESKTTPIPRSPTKYYNNKEIKKYNDTIKKICNDLNIKFIDILI